MLQRAAQGAYRRHFELFLRRKRHMMLGILEPTSSCPSRRPVISRWCFPAAATCNAHLT